MSDIEKMIAEALDGAEPLLEISTAELQRVIDAALLDRIELERRLEAKLAEFAKRLEDLETKLRELSCSIPSSSS